MARTPANAAALLRDGRLAVRRLRYAPAFSLFSVLVLALAIGATTSVYSLARSVMRPPPGVTTLDRLMVIDRVPPPTVPNGAGFSGPEFTALADRQTAFSRVAAWAWRSSAIAAHGQSGTGDVEMVTAGYFDVIGVRAALGRTLGDVDAAPRANPAVVISDHLWRRMFDGAPDVVGQTLRVNGLVATVVGVAPVEFSGLRNNGVLPTSLWMPIEHSSFSFVVNGPDFHMLFVRGLLAPGRSVASAQAEVSAIAAARDRTDPIVLDAADGGPRNLPRRWTALTATSLDAADLTGALPVIFTIVMTLLALVLLVACANLANLTLARGEDRRLDVAVRTALGASRWSLVREALVECACIAAVGGLGGVLLARAGAWWLTRDIAINTTVLRLTPEIDGAALAVSAAACGIALIVVGLVPALRSTRRDIRSGLAHAANHSTLRWTGRRWLVVAQVAVSVVFVLLAGWCTERLVKAEGHDGGIDIAHLAFADVDFGAQQYDAPRAAVLTTRILERIAAFPGIEAAAASTGLPPNGNSGRAWLRVEVVDKPRYADLLPSTPDLFRTTRVRLIEGRSFNSSDDLIGKTAPKSATTPAGAAGPVAIVSERLARLLYGTPHAVGRKVGIAFIDIPDAKTDFPASTIVGVVADPESVEGFPASKDGTLYVPLGQHFSPSLRFTARTEGDPDRAADAIRRAIHGVDTELAIGASGAGESLTGIGLQRVMTTFASALGAFALIIALAGVYGVLAHVVSKRTREIGIRMALGAGRTTIWRMVLGDGLRPVVLGVFAGVVLGAIGRGEMRALFALLRGMSAPPPMDPAVLIVALVAIVIVGAVACLHPAMRASRVDPSVTLRDL